MTDEGEMVPVEACDKRSLRERGLRIAVSATGVALVLTAVLLLVLGSLPHS